ncbi:HEAT repeat domain-containing protein [Aeoliella sp. ICT_H6.2]|uniref:HEAT repeat domain-containing protein n=1 Tax=Aeoliella straminimaris TaxID=2954799 RepID=A0A9X2FIE9_9BACT|nr:HEAT repeat domain-containing protein [Aeoliella straminimaris]MCO6047046.1 HEAT repeat domain-containing protein [Aeoliella straminimaris]
MFTFGREHEKKRSGEYLRNPDELHRIHYVIDAVHDLLDGSTTDDEVKPVISGAFVDGGSGVWEQTGNWLVKIGREYPNLSGLWTTFASHRSSTIRFRAAAYICDVPDEVFAEIFPQLLNDKSAKVRSKVAGDIAVSPRLNAKDQLLERLAIETDPTVRESLDWAIKSTSELATES